MRHAGKSEEPGRVQQVDGARVGVCGSDEEVRPRIEEILGGAGHEIVDVTSSLEELIGAASLTEPQLVVVVSALEPFEAGAEIGLLRAALPSVPLVLVVTGSLHRASRKLVLSEVDGLVHESELEAGLLATIKCTLAGQLCVPIALCEHLAQPVFSHRERQVLELIVAGLTNGEIGARLYLSESTVKSHLASSFRKLGVSSRAEASRRVLDPDSGFELNLQLTPAASASQAVLRPV